MSFLFFLFYFLAILALLVYAVFVIRTAARIALWLKGPSPEGVRLHRKNRIHGQPFSNGAGEAGKIGAAILDIVLLRRLFRVNRILWVGEWVFHVSLLLVIIRHLKYFLAPVPQFVWQMQSAGRAAGYVLPFSLLYIIFVKVVANRGRQMFAYNYFLLSAFFLISALGVLMSVYFYPNVMAVKEFTMFTLNPGALFSGALPQDVAAGFQGEGPFVAHFILALTIFLYLPTHIFAAPFTIYRAKKRQGPRQKGQKGQKPKEQKTMKGVFYPSHEQ